MTWRHLFSASGARISRRASLPLARFAGRFLRPYLGIYLAKLGNSVADNNCEPRARPELRVLLPYATEAQRRVVEAIEAAGSNRKAAAYLGIGVSNVTGALKRLREQAAKHGLSPEHDLHKPVAPGQMLRGASTLYDKDGRVVLQWVKSKEDRDEQARILKEHARALAEDLPKFEAVKRTPGRVRPELMAVIPMGDPHFGMYAWAEETGENFDLNIARRDLCAAVDYLVRQMPRCGRCVIVNLGDFFHADNMVGVTSRSGNVLDMDSRLPNMYRVGVTALRQCITSALRHHETVEVINAVGNHDEVLSFTLSTMLAQVYESEPRVKIHDEPTSRHYVRHGRNLLGVVHGHQTKDSDLPGIMATERPSDWGETRHRQWLRGHEHQERVQEFNGCKVRQFPTLAAKDGFHVANGYLSQREMHALLLHEEHGLGQQFRFNLDMLRDLVAA